MNNDININSVIHGDMLVESLLIPNGSIDMVLTDIPYGIDYKSNWSNKKRISNDKSNDFELLMPLWIQRISELLTPTGVAVIFCGGGGGKYNSYARVVLEAEKHINTIQTVVWLKYIGMGWKYRSQYELALVLSHSVKDFNFYDKSNSLGNVFKYNQFSPSKDQHPTQKPLALLKKFIMVHSKEGDTILDPFAGSGSTGIACMDLNRNFIMIEIDKYFYEMADKNISMRASQINLF